MTAYQALSLALQFGLLQITALTFIVTIVVYLIKKK